MENIFNIILLYLSIVYVYTLSGFIDSIKRGVWKLISKLPYVDIELKPFTCGKCMSFWTTLIYQIIYCDYNLIQIFSLSLLMAYLYPFMSNILIIIFEYLKKITNDE